MRIPEDLSDSPLLIAQVDSTQDETTGDFYYRTIAPGAGMACCEGVHVVNLVNFHRLRSELMLDADVLVLNNICDADLLPVIRDRKARGKLTVYELCDDLGALSPSNPMRAFYHQTNNLLLIKRLAHYCDALQFSSPELKCKYGYLNRTCCVFPNQILAPPPARRQESGEIVVIGWGGSIGHLHDMEKISDRLIHWIMSRDNVHLYLMCADPIWELFEALPEDRKRRFATGSVDDYYSFVSHLDIGLAPLEDTAFNRSRSDVKFLEYAACGAVPVVQAAGPYLLSVKQGKTGFLFKTPDELIATLDNLASDASLRIAVSASARQYVLQERNYLDRGRDRVEFYRSLLPANAGKRNDRIITAGNYGCDLPGGTAEGTFACLSNCAGAKKTGRHILLSSTRYELLLQAGVLGLNSPNPSEAWNMFQEAIDMEPSIYLPYLFGAFVSHDPIQTLKKAIERNPSSIVSWISLGRAHACLSKGGTEKALESFKAAARIFPEYERPYIECANCLKNKGFEKEGIAMLKKAIELIPKAIREPGTCSQAQ
jgi:glycosyltransferase involved in cell wall biosynthesis